MNAGSVIELEINDVAYGGAGVGRCGGMAVFVPFTIGGERVRARVREVLPRFARAGLEEVLSASPDRVSPRCPWFGKCGGCQYQHIAIGRQRAIKRSQLAEALRRIGGIENPPVPDAVPSPADYGYRTRIELHGPGKPGYREEASAIRVEIESCAIARPEINLRFSDLAGLNLEAAQTLCIRCNRAGVVQHFRTLSRSAGRQVRSSHGRAEQGEMPDDLFEPVAGIRFRVPAGAFFQVNPDVAELVVQSVADAFAASGSALFVDAYCGVGLFALALAGRAKKCFGVESAPDAVRAARQTAAEHGIRNADFLGAPAERALDDLWPHCRAPETAVFLDPPRSGCSSRVLQSVCAFRPARIMYLSCVPPVLARDAALLAKAGYRLEAATPFDMFPQTGHCEALAVFAPRET